MLRARAYIWLSHSFALNLLARAGVCRQERRKPSRGLQRFAIGGLSSIGITYYHAAYLAGADMSSAAPCVRTQSRGLDQHSNGSAFIVRARRSEQSAPCRCG